MIETILIALLFAKIRGYKIKPLFKSWTIYPLIFLEISNLIGQILILFGNYKLIECMSSLKTIYLSIYLLFVFKYEVYTSAIIGSVFVFLGGLLNDIAIKVNGGFMPVYPTLSYLTNHIKIDKLKMLNDTHILGNSQTKLKFLTDFIDLGYTILSIGDIFIRIFVFAIIYNSIKKINNVKSKEERICYNYQHLNL